MKAIQEQLAQLADYFLDKYPDREILPDQTTDGKLYHLAAVSTMEERVREEDRQFMKEYEDLLLSGMHTMLLSKNVEEDCEQVERIIRNGIGKAVLFGDLSRFYMDEVLCSILCGYAFVNYRLSPILHGFLTFCMQIDARRVLDIISRADKRNDFEKRGGHMDDIFYLRPEVLIEWAAEHKRTDFLQIQFAKNPTAYLKCYETASDGQSDILLCAIRESDPKRYKALLCEREQSNR